jgi:hypothetical protein
MAWRVFATRWEGMVLTDNLAASGLGGSFTLSADIFLTSSAVRNTIFSTRTDDPTELQKLTSLVKLAEIPSLSRKKNEKLGGKKKAKMD